MGAGGKVLGKQSLVVGKGLELRGPWNPPFRKARNVGHPAFGACSSPKILGFQRKLIASSFRAWRAIKLS